jgi:hypothetical protein
MKKMLMFVLAASLVGCNIMTKPEPKLEPEQALIDAVLKAWGASPSMEQVKVTDYVILPLNDADKLNGVDIFVCLSLSYPEQLNGSWKEDYISLEMQEVNGKWQVEPSLQWAMNNFLSNPSLLINTALTGNCNWARADYGIKIK